MGIIIFWGLFAIVAIPVSILVLAVLEFISKDFDKRVKIVEKDIQFEFYRQVGFKDGENIHCLL
jgi:predicted Co/Zn/Cd cation transporter (cation efflux family)